jgi:hypothetical protein
MATAPHTATSSPATAESGSSDSDRSTSSDPMRSTEPSVSSRKRRWTGNVRSSKSSKPRSASAPSAASRCQWADSGWGSSSSGAARFRAESAATSSGRSGISQSDAESSMAWSEPENSVMQATRGEKEAFGRAAEPQPARDGRSKSRRGTRGGEPRRRIPEGWGEWGADGLAPDRQHFKLRHSQGFTFICPLVVRRLVSTRSVK